MSGGVVVTRASPVVVVPSESEPAPSAVGDTVVTLSSFDLSMLPLPITLLLTFDQPIGDAAETVKAALSRALAHYRPIAGRLDGRAGIACTGEGVTFVAASAACCTVDEALAALPPANLVVRYPGLLCRDAEPLLQVQVTELSGGGGFVVGVTWNHLAADGAGMAQFLRAVGELARGVSPPSVVPVRRWDDGCGAPALRHDTLKAMVDGPRSLARVDVDVAVPSSLIRRVKAESGATVFEAVAAVLWRCRTRAAASPGGGDDEPSPAPLTFPYNVRKHAGARAGYYGNCIAMQVVPATSGAVASSGLGDLVGMIRRPKEKVPELLSGSSGGGGGTPAEDRQQQEQRLGWYDVLAVLSWRNLGLEVVDFGGGAPARVLWHDEQPVVPICVVYPPRKGRDDDGVDVSSMCVKPEHADAFRAELALLAASAE